jgi:MacB-like periplasmic core domain
MLLQARGWTAVVVVSLALGIGANTALFSAVNGLLFRKLPVTDPDRLVRFRYAGPNQMRTDVLTYGFSGPDARGRQVEPTFSYPMYQQFLEENRTLSDLFACAPLARVTVVVNGQAEIASGFLSSGNYHRALGATARLGRTILPDDDRPAATPVAVISHKYWMSRFSGSPSAVGAVVRVNNVPVTIVGVLAPDFTGVEQAVSNAPDVSLPLSLEPQIVLQPSTLQRSLLPAANFWWLQVMGRMKPGVSNAQVRANFEGVFQRAARSGFDAFLSSLPPEERSKSYLQKRIVRIRALSS